MRKEDILKHVQYLQNAGMPEECLADIHHLDRPETYNSSLQYFASGGDVQEDGANEHYARRLQQLVDGHKEGRTDWRTMAQEARAAWPI
ncbi:hypothetical protein [Dinoroseobacter sp. S124A]|uniref:hypothetical protein n=1 Tax=Dinoroseobacter sp. S124A TaxID=3415128 RepID=UPI003C7A1242